MADPRSRVHAHVGMQAAIFADPAPSANDAVRTDLRTIPDMRVFSDHCIRADAYIFSNMGQRGNDYSRVNANGDRPALHPELPRPCKRYFRLDVP